MRFILYILYIILLLGGVCFSGDSSGEGTPYQVIEKEIVVEKNASWFSYLFIIISLILLSFSLIRFMDRRWLWFFTNFFVVLISWNLLVSEEIKNYSLIDNNIIYLVVLKIVNVNTAGIEMWNLVLWLLFAHLWVAFCGWLYDAVIKGYKSFERKKPEEIPEAFNWFKR